ncbi:hypothetical protein AALP_AA5G052900 [Arabis alpina]|uniref:Multidrug resistance protein n=1 Tax=Arabis alpina TaxID=50452 RepID=A0A087GV34_ARAAL|nr:hypothetical protein AALP_AA5G052900 [Arabis alpina]
MREKYLRAVLRQDVGYFDLHVTSTTDVITSVSSDSLVIQDVLSEKLPNLLMNVSAFFGSYIVAFIMLWRLTIVGLPFIILLLIPGLMYGRTLISISRKIREEYNEAGSIAEQAISLVRTVYAFGSERKIISKFSNALEGSAKLGLRQGLVKGIAIGCNGITFAIWGFMTWYGSRMVMYHGAKGGTVYAVIICISYGGTTLGRGLSNLKYFAEAVVAGERITKVIKRVPAIDSNNLEGQILEKVRGEVEFKNVKFVYPSRPETSIFDDFCLRVPSGKTVALVGGSGSGKSTVISLLQRFYDPVAGAILIDGVSIDKLQVKWLRSQMGLVSQEPALFATSIKENILFGKEDASMEDVVEAAKASNAHNFISQLPNGYETQVGERGVQMSGGQKQRIAIARALIKSPTILLLDEATSALDSESEMVRSLVGERVSLVVQTISAVSISCTLGLVIAWRLAIVMIAVQPLVVVCFYVQRILLKSLSKKAIEAQDESSKLAAEGVSNIRTITAFSSQDRILKLLKRVQEGPLRESIRQSWLAGIVLGTTRSLITCTSVLSFWYGGRLIADGMIMSKSFFEMFLIFVSTGRVIADAGTMTTDLAKGSDAVGAVFALIDRSTIIEPENPNGYLPEKINGQIRFLNVDFAYPTRPYVIIFKDFSIEMNQGKSTAIVGPSGSGKSTIISLIERFYDPLNGTVRIDGRDIRSYHLRSLRQHIGLVSQEPMLFAGTIRENIMYGGAADNINEAEIIEAAKAANAHDFITSLSDGYDTNCGDRGVQLSGGQKQRIAIARAMLKNPSVLLLDEATSALDSQSERVVQDALERVMVGRTSVVIAHSLSTIQNCDAIAVLDKGKVVESGTHSSLLAKGSTGVYSSLVSLQRTRG